MENEISKAEFKEIYLKYATENSGWTLEYWDAFFEKEGQCYFVFTSDDPDANRMFIRKEGDKQCIYFLTEDSEESFFNFPAED